MDLADCSSFTATPPRLRGPLPRLAQHLTVERLAACLDVPGGDAGMTASLEALGALAEGFPGEPGGFIRRCVSSLVSTAYGMGLEVPRTCLELCSDGGPGSLNYKGGVLLRRPGSSFHTSVLAISNQQSGISNQQSAISAAVVTRAYKDAHPALALRPAARSMQPIHVALSLTGAVQQGPDGGTGSGALHAASQRRARLGAAHAARRRVRRGHAHAHRGAVCPWRSRGASP